MTSQNEVILLFTLFLLCGLDGVFSKDEIEVNDTSMSNDHSSLKIETYDNYKVRQYVIVA